MLFTVHYSQSTCSCTLLTVHYSLYTINSTLFTVHQPLYTIHGSLFTVHSSLYTIHCTLTTVHYSLHSLHCILFTAHSSLFTIHCILFTVHSSLYTIHLIIFTIHSSLYPVLNSAPVCTLHCTLYCTVPFYTMFTALSSIPSLLFPVPYCTPLYWYDNMNTLFWIALHTFKHFTVSQCKLSCIGLHTCGQCIGLYTALQPKNTEKGWEQNPILSVLLIQE